MPTADWAPLAVLALIDSSALDHERAMLRRSTVSRRVGDCQALGRLAGRNANDADVSAWTDEVLPGPRHY